MYHRRLLLSSGAGPGWLVSGFGRVGSLRALAAIINVNPSVNVTLLGNYNAAYDGTFTGAVFTSAYTGTFDGNNFTISNLRIANTTTGASVADALFYQIDTTGVVKNLRVMNATVTGNGAYTAVLCGLLDGLADNCILDGYVSNNGVSSKLAVGVSFVRATGTFSNFFCSGSVVALNTGDYHGGAVALAYGAVTGGGSSCTTDSSAVQSGFGSWNGCLIGVLGNTVGNTPDTHNTAIVSNCYATGNSIGNSSLSSQNYVGAFVGNALDGTITGCYATGNATGGNVLGGFAGRIQGGRIVNCYSKGTVTGTQQKVGTFAGQVDKIVANGTNSLTIGTGSTTFTGLTSYTFTVGITVRAYSAANSANYMEGTVTASTSSTVTVNVTTTGGAGTFSDWIIKGTYASVTNCWASGSATGVQTVGMFGYASTYAELDHIFNYGNAVSSGKPYAGGLFGQLQGTVTQAYSVGGVAASASYGGVVGNLNTSASASSVYWNTTTTGLSRAAGTVTSPSGMTGRTTAQLTSALPAGFDGAWTRDGSGVIAGGYPYLTAVTAPPAPNVIPPVAPTQIILTATGTNNWTVPADWNNSNNTIEAIGEGGNGGTGSSTTAGRGGGGGAYSKITNLAASPGDIISYTIGAGNSSTKTQFKDGSTLVADFGVAGTTAAAGTGGTVANSVGATKFAGGGGGSVASAAAGGSGGGAGSASGTGRAGASGAANASNAGGGGGGAAGGGSAGTAGSGTSGGNGGDAADTTPGGVGSSNTGVAGTAGNSGSGGGGGYAASGGAASAGGAGGAGTEYGNGTAGAGGGGGGGGGFSGIATGAAGGAGGNYGAGGGGGGRGTSPGAGGAGSQGVIIITYTPAS